MESSNRITILCALVWLLCLVAALFLHDEIEVEHQLLGTGAEAVWPLNLTTGDVLVSRLQSPASTRLVALDIHGITSSDLLIRIGVEGAWPVCTELPRSCRLMVSVKEETSVYMSARGPAVITGIEATVVRHQWSAAAASGFPVLILGILLMLPLSWMMAGKPELQRRSLLAMTVAVMFWLQPVFSLLVLALLCVLHRAGTRAASGSRIMLTGALIGAALILVTAKYAISGIDKLFANPGGFDLALPLGISYVVIRLVDTQIRWYRNQLRDVPLDEFLFFVLFPATLAAGPVDTLERFRSARIDGFSRVECAAGLRRVGWGVFKKLIVADAFLHPLLWSSDGYGQSVLTTASGDPLTAVAFLFLAFAYVYVDFSAYSDIAAGLSRMLGWSAPENFNYPFLARSIMDYWRRWHMSVSGWCMRNIYMPLLISSRRPVLASLMVMLAVGMWHSVSLSWLMWALHHGLAIAIESTADRSRRRRRRTADNGPANARWSLQSELKLIPARAGTLVWVAAGHSFAQIEDPEVALDVYFSFWSGIISIPSRMIQ